MQGRKLLYFHRTSGLIHSKATVRFIQVPWGLGMIWQYLLRNPELQEFKSPQMPVSLTRVVCSKAGLPLANM
jgi:hypothetical protein